jgi:Anti-sigma-K factor rskA
VTDEPNFDELVGDDVAGEERERMRRVHDLLVAAGPPAELPPEIEAGPTLAMTLGGPARRRITRRVALLAAALVVLVLAFLGGYIAGNGGDEGGLSRGHVLKLEGTAQAPQALASLRILPVDPSGNWAMKLSATGLPKLPPRGYYEVWVVRDAKIFAPCGWFKVKGPESGVLVWLNAPYELQPHDSWVVTRRIAGQRNPGPVVLRPVNA